MNEQLQLFDPNLNAYQFEPARYVLEGAKRYAKERGFPEIKEPQPGLQVNNIRGYATNLAYRKALADPQEAPGISRSYKAATEHIRSQYEFMTRPEEQGGLGIKHEVVTEDPYKDAHEMAADVRDNRRIRTYATSTSAAGDKQAPTLQAFDNETNDMLRAVHDVFGHAALGRDFSRHGEEAAYVLHSQMFPKQARAAMASELRGQNSYLIFGEEHEFPNPGTKKVGLPEWASKTGPMPRARRAPRKKYDQLQLDL